MSAVDANALVWMRNTETGGVTKFAAAAVEAWEARGWELCDPPVVVEDSLRDPQPGDEPKRPNPDVAAPEQPLTPPVTDQIKDEESAPAKPSRAGRGTQSGVSRD